MGDDVTLSCKYSTGHNSDALQWYRQYPTSRPEFLVYIYPHENRRESYLPHLSTEVVEKRVDLLISSATESDSALYYCALKLKVMGNIATLYKNLSIKKELKYRIYADKNRKKGDIKIQLTTQQNRKN